MKTDNRWTAAEVELLTLRAPLCTGQEIADMLGRPRNSVAGKAARLGLTLGRDRPTRLSLTVLLRCKCRNSKDPGKRDAIAQARRRVREKQTQAYMTTLPAGAPVSPVKESTPMPLVSPLAARECDCRFPVGEPRDPDFKYCGRRVVAGQSWCGEHMKVCYSGTRYKPTGQGFKITYIRP
jgi:GcrA cell cycle regulator